MIMSSLQPRLTRHLIGSTHADFRSLVQALYDVEEGISRGLWLKSSHTDPNGKNPLRGQHSDVGVISTFILRQPRYQ